MISYDASKLFPSVPIEEAIRHILHLLENDADLHKRTGLSPYDIADLINLCLSSTDFVYNDRHHTTENSGPIGLSLMVRVSQIWMDYTMDKALKLAKQQKITIPRNIELYMDDIWLIMNDPPRREGLRSHNTDVRDPVTAFNDCLNAVHPRVQFTREIEENGSIPFLDVLISKQDDGTLETSIYRKPSNTNVCIKPQSCQEPKTSLASFKGELCRCYRICSTPERLANDIEFTLQLYVDNGHNKQKLQQIIDSYTPPSPNQIKDRKSNKNKQEIHKTPEEMAAKQLFDQLPFINENPSNEEQKTYACITYIPEIAHQLKRILKKGGVNTAFKSAPKLKDILCSKNKTHAPATKKKGIYKYKCTCSDKSIYIGQTARSFDTRWQEHSRAIEKQQWSHSGVTQHHQQCTQFNKDNFEPLHTMQGKKKLQLGYNLRIREAMEIRRHNSGPGKGLNEDMGAYIRTDMWDPVLGDLT